MLHFTSRLCQPQKRHVYNSKQTKPIWTYLHYTTLIWRLKCIVYRLHNLNCVHLQVYAVGGYDGQSRLSSVECYDSFSNRWTEVAPMKEAVSSPAVASCVNKLFVIGGGPDDNTCSDKVCWRVWRMVLRSRVSLKTALLVISACHCAFTACKHYIYFWVTRYWRVWHALFSSVVILGFL